MHCWRTIQVEPLENRLVLAVFPAIVDGNLIVGGSAFGDVEIVAVDEDSFRVVEGGRHVATVDNVTGGIIVQLELFFPNANDVVVVDLNEQTVDFIYGDLGDGDNSFTLRSGRIELGVSYIGGFGKDVLILDEDLHAGTTVAIRLGEGENLVDFQASVDSLLAILGGAQNAQVLIGEIANISGSTAITATEAIP